MVKNDRKLDIFKNIKMFAIFKLWYLRQYIIHFKLIYIFKLLTSSEIHICITHIYQQFIKTRKDAAKPNSESKQIATEMSVVFVVSNFRPANLM